MREQYLRAIGEAMNEFASRRRIIEKYIMFERIVSPGEIKLKRPKRTSILSSDFHVQNPFCAHLALGGRAYSGGLSQTS
jgi:hypothetical protein